MEMKLLSKQELHALKVDELGLDSEIVDLSSIESVACALRRAAFFLCPCASSTLVRSVVGPLRGIVDDLEKIKLLVESTLKNLIAHGDIIEQDNLDTMLGQARSLLLYAASPSFVMRESGTAIILGIPYDNTSLLPEELNSRIDYSQHIRQLTPELGEDLHTELINLGFIELTYPYWIGEPEKESPNQYKTRMDELLKSSEKTIDIPGLRILDPTQPTEYYPDRWVTPNPKHTGNFVARRKQAYGADLWSYVELKEGAPTRFIDLPIKKSKKQAKRWPQRGCDEAWRLQMAIDYLQDAPQIFNIRILNEGSYIIDFYSPVPMWATKRWDTIGEPVEPKKCLLSYKFKENEKNEEINYIKQQLWLSEKS